MTKRFTYKEKVWYGIEGNPIKKSSKLVDMDNNEVLTENKILNLLNEQDERIQELESQLDKCKQVITDDIGYKEMNKRLGEILL